MPPTGPRKPASRHQLSAGGVVFRRGADGVDVALIRAGGRWSFPKGNAERDETPEVTALREISEETGLPAARLRIVDRLPDVTYAFRWGPSLVFKTVQYFLVQLMTDAPLRPQLSEIEEVRWFDAAAARRTLSFKNARETLDAAVARLEGLELAS